MIEERPRWEKSLIESLRLDDLNAMTRLLGWWEPGIGECSQAFKEAFWKEVKDRKDQNPLLFFEMKERWYWVEDKAVEKVSDDETENPGGRFDAVRVWKRWAKLVRQNNKRCVNGVYKQD